jgi:HK97 family phage major capsid protein
LEEKSAEITAMQNSKKTFSDRSTGSSDLSKFGKEFMTGHFLGVMTGKGWGTKYASDLAQKAGINYTDSAANIAQGVSTQIEKEIMLELKLAQAFREITINSQTQVLPIQTDAGPASWAANATAGNLENRPQITNVQYDAAQVILKANRLISTTFMDNNIDEEVLVNLMPMLIEGVARAHARAVDDAILNGTSGGAAGFNGLEALAGSVKVDVLDANASGGTDLAVTAAEFLAARKLMGKYGMNASDLVYVVSQARYYDLLADAAFADITDVGSDIATKITGTVGAIYGTPVIVSDQIEAEADGASVGYAVNVRNHVIPRLRGVSIEQDYEVMNQRNVIVASQSLGFNQLRPNNGTTDVSVVALKRTDA